MKYTHINPFMTLERASQSIWGTGESWTALLQMMKVMLAHPALLLEQLVQLALLAGQLDRQVLAARQELLRILQPKGTGDKSSSDCYLEPSHSPCDCIKECLD